MRNLIVVIFLVFVPGCAPPPMGFATVTPTALSLAVLPEGCISPGEIINDEIAEPARGYPYSYRVYLPPCFTEERETRYPVLYLIPGRSSTPDSWLAAGIGNTVDRLILNHDIPPLIIITTENIDFDPQAETIYKELIPFVENKYPIAADRHHRAVAGGSLGGIAAYRLAFQHPDLFSSAGIFGAGAISGEEKQINSWLAAMTEANHPRVFMDTGDEDILMLERAQALKSILDQAGIENQLHVGHGGHNYTYWAGNFEMYLKWMAKDW